VRDAARRSCAPEIDVAPMSFARQARRRQYSPIERTAHLPLDALAGASRDHAVLAAVSAPKSRIGGGLSDNDKGAPPGCPVAANSIAPAHTTMGIDNKLSCGGVVMKPSPLAMTFLLLAVLLPIMAVRTNEIAMKFKSEASPSKRCLGFAMWCRDKNRRFRCRATTRQVSQSITTMELV
jgi:hypothetical protein